MTRPSFGEPIGYKNTGKFLTPEQIETVRHALSMPLIAPGGIFPELPQKIIHQYAREAGLPEITGYYGADLATGEIIEPSDG